jgi:hypothetical protein
MNKVQKKGFEACVTRKLNYSDVRKAVALGKRYVFCLATRNRAASDADDHVMLQGLIDYLNMLFQLECVRSVE